MRLAGAACLRTPRGGGRDTPQRRQRDDHGGHPYPHRGGDGARQRQRVHQSLRAAGGHRHGPEELRANHQHPRLREQLQRCNDPDGHVGDGPRPGGQHDDAGEFSHRGGGTQKRAFIYLEFQQTDTSQFKDVQWDSAYSAGKPTHIVLQNGVTVIRNNLMRLPPVTPKGKVAPGGYAPFRLTGDAVASPTDEWTTDDGIDVRIAFTFKPLPYHQW